MFEYESTKSPFFNIFSFLEKKRRNPRTRRLRGFEQLEDRLALSVAVPSVSSIPDEITIYAGSSWHYTAQEDAGFKVEDDGNLTGLEAVELSGRTVTIQYEVTDSETGEKTDLGEIVIQLFDDDAPISADRFYRLADTSESGFDFFEGRQVARIDAGLSIIQAGGDNGTLIGDSGQPAISQEPNWKLSENSAGVVVFCAGGGEVGDQFYIVWDTATELDYDYNVLGFIVSGYDTLEALSELETKDRPMGGGTEKSDPVDTVVMKTVTVSPSRSSDVFRISAAAGTSGTSDIVLSVTGDDGYVVEKTVTVNVIDLESAENEEHFELNVVSGTTTRMTLPSRFGTMNGSTYTGPEYYYLSSASEVNTLPEGITLKNDSSYKYFEVSVDESYSGASSFELKLSVYHGSPSSSSQLSKTIYYDVNVIPPAPVFNMENTVFAWADDTLGSNVDIPLTVDSGSGTITFDFADGVLVPGNMQIVSGEDNVSKLTWTPQGSEEGYEYNVPVKATDSIGRSTFVMFTFKASIGPSFDILDAEGKSVSNSIVELNESEEAKFSIALSVEPEEGETLDYSIYQAQYKLYRLTTDETGAETRTEVADASGVCELAEGRGIWSRVFNDENAPGDYIVEFEGQATYNDADVRVTKKYVKLRVKESNVAPVITFVQNEPFSVKVGESQQWVLTATDANVPAQPLSWRFAGSHSESLTLTTGGILTFAPTQNESGTEFTATVVVSDGSLSDSMTLSFVVPAIVPEGDNAVVQVPEPLPPLETSRDCKAAWGNVNEYRLEQIQVSTDRFVAAFTGATEKLNSTITSLASELNEGTITHDEYVTQCRQAAISKNEEQVQNVLNLQTRNAAIDSYAQEQYDTISDTAQSQGIELETETTVPQSEPIRLTYAQMQQIWQSSLPNFAALPANLVDTVFSSYL